MEDISAFKQALSSSKNIIIVAGAGLSAASGIPTYRGAGGLWLNFDETKLAKPEAFKEDPSQVWQFYHPRRQMCLDAEPNAAHRALATFCLPETLARVAPSLDPKWPAPLLITQNMDALSSRVLSSFSSADKEVAEKCIIEMHGCIFETRCTSCAHVQRAYTPTPSSDALAAAQASESPMNIPVEDLPRCGGPGCTSNRYGRCGGLLRPNVVWFGEVPKHMGDIAMRMNWCDLLLLVGTSTTVHPAAGFAKTVKNRGGKVAVFNLERNDGVDADFTFVGKCEETLPQALTG
ncbi:sirtuin [Mycena albidolilacea]|uniref:Sirtuin n=1 Tax=Mycena albidolilacea TaxID=1033008 RepID=A0AAD7ES54_9AGAR|nr:sirtuin [Mycena albidolilacea]